MTEDDVVWEDPPPATDRRRWAEAAAADARLLAALRAHPGRWARYTEHAALTTARTVASRIRNGHRRVLAGCEATNRTVEGKTVVYIRWPEAES